MHSVTNLILLLFYQFASYRVECLTGAELNNEALHVHNRYRWLHGVDGLKLDRDLITKAEKVVQNAIANRGMNLFWFSP